MNFSPAFLAELNALVDLSDFIGRYVSDLKKTSGDTHAACCPFHNEKTASFTVSNRKGFYHCFGCGVHGNAIGFLMEKMGLAFPDAVKEVASFVGMPLPHTDRPEKTEVDKQQSVRFMRAGAALDTAQSIYQRRLESSDEARDYLQKRGVTQESIDRFGIGYAPGKWDTITGSRSFSKEQLADAGLSTTSEKAKNPYDRFRDRIMFPIYGRKDRVVGFGGREIGGQSPKYLNSPETMLFDKGDNLYGIKQAKESIHQTGRMFVVEGYMDVVMVSQYGVNNIVASLGTSVTENQMRIMFALSQHITFCMDGDEPGRKAAWRAAENILPLLDEKHKVDFMFMPDDIDPDDFVRAHGKEGFEQAADAARTLTDFVLDQFMLSTDVDNGESLAEYLFNSNELADKIESSLMKLSFQKQISELAGISLDTMLQMLKEQSEKKQSRLVQTQSTPAPLAVPEEPVVAQPVFRHIPEISVAAKMLGISVLKNKSIADYLDPAFLFNFLSVCDKEMLFPLLAYIKANPTSTDASLLASMEFNPHAKVISFLSRSVSLLGAGFEATTEAKIIIDGFRKMERVQQIVADAQVDEKH